MRVRTSLASSAAVLALAATGTSTGSTTAPAAAPVAPQAVTTVHWSEADGLGTGMATATTSTALYRFSTVLNGKPVRWNPCRAIRWRYNPRNQPTWLRPDGTRLTGLAVIKTAMAKVSAATGIPWVYDGSTTATPTSKWLPTSVATIRPVLIGWTDGAHSDLLAGHPASTLAVARTAYFKTVVGGVTLAATRGMVIAFDRTNRLKPYGPLSWRSVALHELAHGMGLAHVGTTSQMMHPVLQTRFTELQSGDKAGLYRLGRSQGCINLGF